MQKMKIYSPVGLPNKERYLNKELEKFSEKKICSIKKQENGDIEILVEIQPVRTKYFVKVTKAEEGIDISKFTEERWYQDFIKYSTMIGYIEYDVFCVWFFKK